MRTMKAFAVMSFVAGLLLPHAAGAASAFAAAIPSDVAGQGMSYGTAYNYSTRAAAELAAVQRCQSQTNTPAATLALCKVMAHFDGECLSVSLDPKDGTPGYGWAVGVTADIANTQSLAFCRATAGPDRAGFCVISASNCDTSSGP